MLWMKTCNTKKLNTMSYFLRCARTFGGKFLLTHSYDNNVCRKNVS